MSNPELEKWIRDSAQYLRDKQSRDAELDGRKLAEGQSQTLRDEIKLKLETARKKAQALQDALYPLAMQARDIDFPGMQSHINESWQSAVKATVSCDLALIESLPPPLTKEMRYHQSAAKLAVAIDSGRAARSNTKCIIEAAGLSTDYSEQSLDNWLRKARSE